MTDKTAGSGSWPGSFYFSGKWVETVRNLPESGMGYTIVTVKLKDGRCFNQVAIDSGHLNRVRGLPSVPFTEDDIAEIRPTHDKWNFAERP